LALIVDAGGLISVLGKDQEDHEKFVEALTIHRGPLVVSPLVVAEVDHLILSRLGRLAELAFIDELVRTYQVEDFSNADIARARELCARYADLLTFDLSDASCVVLAERYDSFEILTTDTKDFRNVAGSRGRYFRILPYDL
jgi:uncharacterized protein